MKIGYARVSTLEQNLNLQIDALHQAGCQKIITDEISGSTFDHPGLLKLKELLREGDTLIVWRLDHMSRSLKHLIEWVNELHSLRVGFHSLHESIDRGSCQSRDLDILLIRLHISAITDTPYLGGSFFLTMANFKLETTKKL